EHRLQVVSTLDETDAKTYVVKLVHQMSKNDFYVEILVDKQDEAAYEPMIQMLNQLDQEPVARVAQVEQEPSSTPALHNNFLFALFLLGGGLTLREALRKQ
ncbi:MAG: hypothetical protein ACRDBX_04710, partial [Erysipelotrichaceae bacterium]